MDISVVIPLYNEEESLPELLAWIERVMQENGYSYEVVCVDDGSRDTSWKVLMELAANNPNVKAIRFARNYGKSAAMNTAFEATQGDVVITMDADLQDSPDEIPELYRMVMDDNWDIVSGWKKKRHDPALTKNLPSKLYNGVTRMISGIKLHDMNCGLKAYKGEVVKAVEVYGEMHRYIPVLAKQAGFHRIGEKVVVHQARKYGVTKFGLERFIRGPLDLLSVIFVTRFGKRPMHLFGLWGFITFGIGFLILIWLSIEKLIFNVGGIATRPAFFLGIVTIIVGTQMFLTGFLAELVSRNAPDRNKYSIAEKLRIED